MIKRSINCPNCGAVLNDFKCDHCGSIVQDFTGFNIDEPFWLRFKWRDKIITTRAICNEVNIKVNEPPRMYMDNMYFPTFVKLGDPSLDLEMSFESVDKVKIETE